MTALDDFDRISRAWLDLMPDEAPDRAIDAVLRAVATTPQVRRSRPAFWRPNSMNKLAYAVVAAALVVAVGGALLLIRPNFGQESGGVPTPVSSPSATPTGVSEPLPPELQSRWFGGHRDVVQLDEGSTLLFTADSFEMNESNQWDSVHLLSSSAAAVGDGKLRLELTANGNGCEAGDVGVYSWSLSPSGRTLTVTPDSDDCAARSNAVPGVWWLAGCPNELCLGELDAGTYQSQYIVPRLDPGSSWNPKVGGLTYTVPDGWANSNDAPDSFELVPAAELPPVAETARRRNIGVFRQPTAMTQDRPCSDEVEPGVGRTVSDLVEWLQTVPGLDTTAAAPITIGGYAGQMLDLSRAPDWTATCEGTSEPLVTFLNPGIAVGADQRVRLILLDLGDGDVVAMAVWARDQGTLDTFAPEAMSIIESFQFE